jgi:transcriptional regulator with XRE-family HTH domain
MSAKIYDFVPMDEAPNRIREHRRAAGLSLEKLGQRIGRTKATMQSLETGEMNLTVQYMREIAGALAVAPTDLLLQADNPESLAIHERELIEALRRANDEQREQLLRVAHVLLPQPLPSPTRPRAIRRSVA